MRFKTILADPPWSYVYYSSVHKKTRAEDYYPTEGTDWICSLPVAEIAAKDSTLLLWATNPKLPDAFRVIEAWGYEYKTMLTWVKMSRAAAPRMGMGYHARCCTEHLLVATKGSPGVPPGDRKPTGVFFCPIDRHSAKPDYQYDIAEGYGGPHLEMFCRPKDGGLFGYGRPGWVHTGNECPGNLDMRDALTRLAAQETSEAELARLAGQGGRGAR